MSRTYESSYIVNSFHAVNAETKEVYTPDSAGYITAKSGDTIIFENPYAEGTYTAVNTLVFFTQNTSQKVHVNPGEKRQLYPLYVPANDKKGIQYMRIDSITVLNDCTFYYEGMAC